MFGECLLECFEFLSLCHDFYLPVEILGLFSVFLNYNADERCQINSLERSQEATCYRHPVVLPLGFCAKAGCESFSFSFLFNLADPFFLVNHFTSLHVKYWSRVDKHTHTQICMHTNMSTHTCTPMQTYMYTHTLTWISHTPVHMYVCTCHRKRMPMCAHTHVCVVHACRCIHPHVHEHTCTHGSELYLSNLNSVPFLNCVYIEVYLTYCNLVLFSSVQQSDSFIHIFIIFQMFFSI